MQPKLDNLVIVLVREGDDVYFGWDLRLPIERVSGFLPDKLYRVLRFNEHERSLHLKYDGDAPLAAYKISFEDNTKLLESLNIEKIVVRQRIAIPQSADYPTPNSIRPPVSAYKPEPPRPIAVVTEAFSNTFCDTVSFDIRDAIFETGTITFEAKVKFTREVVKVTMVNPAVKKHFDAVKNYIWKLFGKRKTSCQCTFEMISGKCNAKSVDRCDLLHLSENILEQINEGWVEEYILDNPTGDIYPISDLVDPLGDDVLTGEYVFNQLVKEAKTKHYHHLRYLSARQAIELQKLSVTGKPLSFVFLITAGPNIYLFWETYTSSEATYVWKINGPDEIKKHYSLILTLRNNKRMVYRKKKEPGFSFIEHDYQADLNGFLK